MLYKYVVKYKFLAFAVLKITNYILIKVNFVKGGGKKNLSDLKKEFAFAGSLKISTGFRQELNYRIIIYGQIC